MQWCSRQGLISEELRYDDILGHVVVIPLPGGKSTPAGAKPIRGKIHAKLRHPTLVLNFWLVKPNFYIFKT